MTTIAYREGQMAADTQITAGMETVHGYHKLSIEPSAYMWGFNGAVADHRRTKAWMRQRFSSGMMEEEWTDWIDEFPEDVSVLLVHGYRNVEAGSTIYKLWAISHAVMLPVPQPFWAIGTGASCALGVMEEGGSARRAVEVAGKYDLYTGPAIDVMNWFDVMP